VNIDHHDESSLITLERSRLALQPLGTHRPKRLARVA